MKTQQGQLIFFLGANTPSGFVSKFGQLTEPNALGSGSRAYILKGGPGSGKSTIIRKVADAFGNLPGNQIIACSSDCDSLDGVVVPQKKFSLLDGTHPHLLEPRYPGAVESVIELSGCWDEGILHTHREEIITTRENISRAHEYACRYMAAAAALIGDTHRIALSCIDMPKLHGYLARLSAKELKPLPGKTGRESTRFLTAVTDVGNVKFTETAKALAERVYLITDEYGALSRLILHHIRARAIECGYDIISCYCPLAPFDKLEQLFIPALGLGFMTSNRFHDFSAEIDPYRVVNTARFMDDGLRGQKKRITFNRKAGRQMIAQATGLIAEAKTLHGELETFYKAATDFDKVDEITDKLLERLAD